MAKSQTPDIELIFEPVSGAAAAAAAAAAEVPDTECTSLITAGQIQIFSCVSTKCLEFVPAVLWGPK